MSESERRRKYRYDRVLIETARVLPSTLADAVVFLSGAQLEMLRNVTQYLRRLETYVTEYNPGYYLTPTPDDYDAILAIVADLEEVLMGNPNTIWGYNAFYREGFGGTKSGDGTYSSYGPKPESDEVWMLCAVHFRNETGSRGEIRIAVETSVGDVVLASALAPGLNMVTWTGAMPMDDDSRLHVVQEGCLDGDTLDSRAVAYKMKLNE